MLHTVVTPMVIRGTCAFLGLFNLSAGEIAAVAVVAVLVFGRRLPQVAVELASQVQRLRRAVADLRRDTGIDRELREARRALESSVPRNIDLVARPTARHVESDAQESPGSEPKPTDERRPPGP